MTVQTAKPRTYVVTGSASRIGAATALMLRARGDRVVGVDLKNADVEADLSTAVGRCRAVDACLDATEGLLDALILCAGLRDPLPDAELALWLSSPQNTLLVGQTLFADLGSAVLQHGLSPLLETGAGGAIQ